MTFINFPRYYTMSHAMLQMDPFNPELSSARRSEIMGGRCWGVHKLATAGSVVATRQCDVDDVEAWDAAERAFAAECDKHIAQLEASTPVWCRAMGHTF